MPDERFSVVTIHKDLKEQIERTIDEINAKAGFRKYRSVAHYVETAVMSYVNKEELGDVLQDLKRRKKGKERET